MKISVCMATYNGSKFIDKQIQSILPQLSFNDELVIVDDCSSDQTVNRIKNFADSRIKLSKNTRNLGVIKNFEKAVNNAEGDIIFFCDQDDIWCPEKILEFVNIFTKQKEVTLVISNFQVIDEDDNLMYDSQLIGEFTSGIVPNLIKPRFRGCTLAFRREMLNYFLPFPKDIPMHDMWIGVVNEIYGKTFYLDRPLIKYRRHSNNITCERRSSILQIIKWRYALFKNLLFLLLKNTIKF